MIAALRRLLAMRRAITPSAAASTLAKAGAVKRRSAQREKIMRMGAQLNRDMSRPMGPEWSEWL